MKIIMCSFPTVLLGGVYSNSRCSSTELTHAMVVTGYGTYNGKDYYLVKNR